MYLSFAQSYIYLSLYLPLVYLIITYRPFPRNNIGISGNSTNSRLPMYGYYVSFILQEKTGVPHMDKEKLGLFVSQLRKEQNMTQKELAVKLGVTDKAISKWERGLSFPDISLLEPLADTFEVSVMELLQGNRISKEEPIAAEPAHEILDSLLKISDDEIRKKHVISKSIIVLCCVSLMLFISIILNIINLSSSTGQPENVPDIYQNAYETMLTEENKEVFKNPEKALSQMTEDAADIPAEWQHLIEILNNTYKEVTE